MISLATTNFFNKMIFPSIYITFVFDILDIYFAFLALKRCCSSSVFKRKNRFGSFATLPHDADALISHFSDPEKSAVRLDDLQTRQKPDQHGDFRKRGSWENVGCWQQSGSLLPSLLRMVIVPFSGGSCGLLGVWKGFSLDPKGLVPPRR